VQRRTHLRTILILAALIASGFGAPASAEEPTTALARPPVSAKSSKSIFDVASLAAATAQQATTGTTAPNDHQFGAGLRINGGRFGIGGSVRYFFYGGPLGVQGEISRVGYDFGNRDWSSVQFSPAVIYRFVERKFEAPLSLVPYAGGGLNFIHSNFDDEDEDFFEDFLDADRTSLGVLLFGGVELFFDRVPNLGVSGEITFTSNDDIEATGLGSTSLGGPAFTAAAHWYFW
jgi:hypothetical protein